MWVCREFTWGLILCFLYSHPELNIFPQPRLALCCVWLNVSQTYPLMQKSDGWFYMKKKSCQHLVINKQLAFTEYLQAAERNWLSLWSTLCRLSNPAPHLVTKSLMVSLLRVHWLHRVHIYMFMSIGLYTLCVTIDVNMYGWAVPMTFKKVFLLLFYSLFQFLKLLVFYCGCLSFLVLVWQLFVCLLVVLWVLVSLWVSQQSHPTFIEKINS